MFASTDKPVILVLLAQIPIMDKYPLPPERGGKSVLGEAEQMRVNWPLVKRK